MDHTEQTIHPAVLTAAEPAWTERWLGRRQYCGVDGLFGVVHLLSIRAVLLAAWRGNSYR